MRTVPDGADVIFSFGEIDCREGLLVAVERARYADLQEGVSRAVEIYVSTLVQLTRARGFRSFVHPVAPVLPPTRPTVKVFNATLQARRRTTPARHSARRDLWLRAPPSAYGMSTFLIWQARVAKEDSLTWLDFADSLLTADGEEFPPELTLDGTHMHPRYVEFIEKALPPLN